MQLELESKRGWILNTLAAKIRTISSEGAASTSFDFSPPQDGDALDLRPIIFISNRQLKVSD